MRLREMGSLERICTLGVLLLTSCGAAGYAAQDCPSARAAAQPITPPSREVELSSEPNGEAPVVGDFVRAPKLTPTSALIEWLDVQAAHEPAPLLVRAPLTFQLEQGKYDASSALFGELAIEVEDSLLPSSVVDHLTKRCRPEARCTISVVGYWRGRAGAPLRLYLKEVGAAYPDSPPGQLGYVEIASTAFSDSCSDWLLQRAELSLELGAKHPQMLALEARLEECPKPIHTRPMQCRVENQRVRELLAEGTGTKHPRVLAAERRSKACEAALEGE